MKSGIKKTDIKEFFKNLKSDSYYRVLVTATFSGSWNFIFAIYHLILALKYHSYWLLTMGIYYLISCFMKTLALRINKENSDKSALSDAFKRNGLLMFLLAFVFSGVVYLSIVEKRNDIKSTIVAITMATYTFYRIIIAIINIIDKNKRNTYQMIILRNISVVFALGSVYVLERMMIGTFGNVNDIFALTTEIVTGSVVFVLVVLFGINSFVLSRNVKEKK